MDGADGVMQQQDFNYFIISKLGRKLASSGSSSRVYTLH